jgi:hypothetical protein
MPMEFTWLGHCCFRMRAKESTVVTDPCDKSTGYSLGRPTADLVTVSFDDRAHNYVEGVAGSPRVINGPEPRSRRRSSSACPRARQGEDAANIAYVIELEDPSALALSVSCRRRTRSKRWVRSTSSSYRWAAATRSMRRPRPKR